MKNDECKLCQRKAPSKCKRHASKASIRKVKYFTEEECKAREQTARAEGAREVYSERNRLVSALSKLFESHLCRHPNSDTSWEDNWRNIVCIHLPTGQATWHIHDDDLLLFAHLVQQDEVRGATPNHWDGHTTEEKYKRLAALKQLDQETEGSDDK